MRREEVVSRSPESTLTVFDAQAIVAFLRDEPAVVNVEAELRSVELIERHRTLLTDVGAFASSVDTGEHERHDEDDRGRRFERVGKQNVALRTALSTGSARPTCRQ